jgi:hypothetical protein
MMFASSFDALVPLIYGIPIVFLALGLISFIPAARGHWSALVLALPAAFVGFILISITGYSDATLPGIKIIWPAPLVVGGLSALLWIIRRRSGGRRA